LHRIHVQVVVVEWIFRVNLPVKQVVPNIQRQDSLPLTMWMLEPIYLMGHSDVGELGEQFGKMFTKGVDVDLLSAKLIGIESILFA